VVAANGDSSDRAQPVSYIHGRVRFMPTHRRHRTGHTGEDAALIRPYRSRLETVNRHLDNMGLQRLHARPHPGFALKMLASLLALTFTNVISQSR
jgi:hypothetical protein